MSTFRVKKRENPFVQIDKTCLKDNTLSWKAKGILAYLLSLPDDWQIYENELTTHCKDKRDSTRAGIKELIAAGYIERTRTRDNKGRLMSYDYSVYEQPIQSGKSNIGESNIGKPNVGESNTTNKDSTNNDYTNNNKTEREAVALSPVDNLHNAIKDDIGDVAYKTWIANLMIMPEGDTVTIKAPDIVIKGMVASKYMSILETRLKSFYGASKVILK